jgi:hypothetical protein
MMNFRRDKPVLLDVNLVKTTPMFCIESGAASVSTWLNRNYEMMFCKMWGFDFGEEDADYPGVIGKRIIPDFTDLDTWKLFETYHGIRIDVQQIENGASLVDVVLSELKKGMPVAVLLRNPCLPWLSKNLSWEPGFILFVGYEDDKLLCLDIHNNLEDIKSISFSSILKGETVRSDDKPKVYSFSIVGDEQKSVTYDDFLLNFKKPDLDKKNPFKAMRSLAECIKTNLDLNHEKCNSDGIYFIPMLINTMHISRTRKLVAVSLDFIGKRSNNPLLFSLSSDFLEAGGEWNQVWNMLNKLYCLKENNNHLKIRVANKISEIADKEELLVNKIINNKYNDGYTPFIQRENRLEAKISDNITFLDIKEYMNNKAFARNELNEEGANFTDQGEFFLGNRLPENNLLNVAGMEFLINPDNLYDNISCSGQNIVLPPGKYKRLMFLGCCEWGERYGDLNIIYSNGKINKTLFYLPDWFNRSTDVMKAWKGQVIGFDHCKEERYLFVESYLLSSHEEIAQIKLPEIANMHIFAISLEKWD